MPILAIVSRVGPAKKFRAHAKKALGKLALRGVCSVYAMRTQYCSFQLFDSPLGKTFKSQSLIKTIFEIPDYAKECIGVNNSLCSSATQANKIVHYRFLIQLV